MKFQYSFASGNDYLITIIHTAFRSSTKHWNNNIFLYITQTSVYVVLCWPMVSLNSVLLCYCLSSWYIPQTHSDCITFNFDHTEMQRWSLCVYDWEMYRAVCRSRVNWFNSKNYVICRAALLKKGPDELNVNIMYSIKIVFLLFHSQSQVGYIWREMNNNSFWMKEMR